MVCEDIDSLKDEILALHRKLAASDLEMRLYKERYESANVKFLAKEKELMELKQSKPDLPLVSDFSKEELISLGCTEWELPSGVTIYLIPFNQLNNIDPDMQVICIDGSHVLAKHMDLDTRGGMLAYGVLPA